MSAVLFINSPNGKCTFSTISEASSGIGSPLSKKSAVLVWFCMSASRM